MDSRRRSSGSSPTPTGAGAWPLAGVSAWIGCFGATDAVAALAEIYATHVRLTGSGRGDQVVGREVVPAPATGELLVGEVGGAQRRREGGVEDARCRGGTPVRPATAARAGARAPCTSSGRSGPGTRSAGSRPCVAAEQAAREPGPEPPGWRAPRARTRREAERSVARRGAGRPRRLSSAAGSDSDVLQHHRSSKPGRSSGRAPGDGDGDIRRPPCAS